MRLRLALVIAALSGFMGVLSSLIVPLFWYRSIQTLHGTTHCTTTHVLVAAILLPLLWIVMAVLCLGVFPALAGLVSLMIESLR